MPSDLSGLNDVIEALRKLDPDLPLICVQALLVVAKRPGMTQTEIAEKLGTTGATASRTLAETLMLRFGLVKQVEDDENRRLKRVFLTTKGERFVEDLVGNLKRSDAK